MSVAPLLSEWWLTFLLLVLPLLLIFTVLYWLEDEDVEANIGVSFNSGLGKFGYCDGCSSNNVCLDGDFLNLQYASFNIYCKKVTSI